MDPSEPSRPNEKARRAPPARQPPPASLDHTEAQPGEGAPSLFDAPETPPTIRLEAAPLLVAARFRDVLLTSRLLVADPRLRRRSGAAAAFHIGAGRGVDAPVNPAYVGGDGARHALLALGSEPGEPCWLLNLGPAMRAELDTGPQRLPVAADGDVAAASAPLVLPARAVLRVRCGEMAFEIRPAGAHAPLPRPWFGPAWRREGAYLAGAALGLLIAVICVFAVPPDPKALSLDDIGRTIRLAPSWSAPPVIPDPPPNAAHAERAAGGSGRPAPGQKGQAGDRRVHTNGRLTVRGPADNPDPRLVGRIVDDIRKTGILGMLRPETSSALASVLEDRPALGRDADSILGQLWATNTGPGFGAGGLSSLGTGAGGADTGHGLFGTGTLHTIGDRTGPGGTGYGESGKVAGLGKKKQVVPQLMTGIVNVRGSLDKEIVRRIVRVHLNEVRYCYEQELPRHPDLAGRLVVQFAIAGNGQVITSVVQSSTIPDLRVGACVTQAVRRWAFPKPEGGGMVLVSYPFQLQPAGGA